MHRIVRWEMDTWNALSIKIFCVCDGDLFELVFLLSRALTMSLSSDLSLAIISGTESPLMSLKGK